ncbi:cation/calcium exchanger 2 [Rosa rugosa]|uniref:cation/calcium exchanger 2 n=1 Tax=Rosa rugosa TaxID=74645 RepID=UPI002B4160EE|nr:cation/calcium exchanger 2 [Rosa rugosa]
MVEVLMKTLFVSIPLYRNYIIFLNLSFLLVASTILVIYNSHSSQILVLRIHSNNNEQDCDSFLGIGDYEEKCLYLKSENPCVSQGYFDYLYVFYCSFGSFPFLGYGFLLFWLLVLFYLLGNTASEYFCSSLESLSKLLQLSPTIAGVTLLSLGNGAPDVFSSFVSFMGSGGTNIDVGLNTVLGGASFISCVVVGIISISIRKRLVRVDKSDFVRDTCFYLLVIVCLVLILIQKEIDVWAAVAFSSLYIVYVIGVYVSHTHRRNSGKTSESHSNLSNGSHDLTVPIMTSMERDENEELSAAEEGAVEHVSAVEEVKKGCFQLPRPSDSCQMFIFILELPLYIPRRLTIPVVCEDRWSKPYAVASVTLAPVLLSSLWNHQYANATFETSLWIYVIGSIIGLVFGFVACLTTDKSSPPKKCLFPWLAAGFLMSVTWSYIIAQELVALLVSIGYILGVSPSILGLTVLAWGNSLGDLITNSTMALKGGPEGAQIAFSACYAGPIFNTLFGLGLSFVGCSWSKYPSAVVINGDPYLLETLGLLAGGLLWALVVLPRRDMALDGVLGCGLLVIYTISLSLRLIQTLGSLQLQTVIA